MHSRSATNTSIIRAALSLTIVAATGCESGLHRIDSRVQSLLNQASSTLGVDAVPPAGALPQREAGLGRLSPDARSESPPTINPPAEELTFTPVEQANDILARLQRYNRVPEGVESIKLDLPASLAYATANSREFMFAQEEYVLAALRLLIERHRWGPRFFDEVSALVVGDGDAGLFDTSLRLVNELRVTQRLPFGGEISARALARATEDLHLRVSGENVQDASVIVEADIPLLRGAGLAAREDRIQTERNLVYAAREFEQFRRDFLFAIAEDFLDLVVQQLGVANAERQVAQLQEVEDRERTLYEAGRTPLFQAALAEQATVSALDALNQRLESYRLAVDRFKLRLNMPIDQPVIIVPSGLDLPVPEIDINEAVRLALSYRLDLQTQRDQVHDAQRLVAVAKNGLLPDFNVVAQAELPTDPDRDRGGARFSSGDSSFSAGVTFGLPLDREIERVTLRQAQIELERSNREFGRLRDDIAVDVRAAVRDIDRARYTLMIQERNIAIGEARKASIEAAPDRATARDASEAANELLVAQDRRDEARRDLQVAVLRYLLETGQLRIDSRGFIRPLPGMMTR